MILLDTDVLIELLKGQIQTQTELRKIPLSQLCISDISLMELFFGALNKKELQAIKKALSNLQRYPLNPLISEKALDLMASYSKSLHLAIPDALIAATALHHQLQLFTYNHKDYRYIKALQLYTST